MSERGEQLVGLIRRGRARMQVEQRQYATHVRLHPSDRDELIIWSVKEGLYQAASVASETIWGMAIVVDKAAKDGPIIEARKDDGVYHVVWTLGFPEPSVTRSVTQDREESDGVGL